MQISTASISSRQEVTPQQRAQFFIFVLIGLCLVFAIGYTSRVLAKIGMDNDVRTQVEENRLAQERTAQLKARLGYVQSDAYIEEKAREDLSMAQPGDRKVVILPQSDGQPQVAPDAILVAPPQPNPVLVPSQDPAIATPTKFDVNPGLPVWRQWLTLFFP